MAQTSPSWIIALFACVWGAIATAGLQKFWKYEATPGPTGQAQATWRATAALPTTTGRATLVMTVHPQCPCSRASLHELEVLVAHQRTPVTTYVIFAKPSIDAADPSTTSLWHAAALIPGVTVISDVTGAMGLIFQAKTSGQVFLYDAKGLLRFSGGITQSRGHVGDNDGRAAIEAILNGSVPKTTTTPIYGCNLE